MVHVLLFHSVLGLRPVELGLADHWRAAGHHVSTPDLFEGRTAETYDDGFAMLRPEPFDEEEVFDDWRAGIPGAPQKEIRNDWAGHHFLDPSLANHAPEAGAACRERRLAFLDSFQARVTRRRSRWCARSSGSAPRRNPRRGCR